MQVQSFPAITSFAAVHLPTPVLTPTEQHTALTWLGEVQQRLLARLSAQVDYLGVLAVTNQMLAALTAAEKFHDPVAQAVLEFPLVAPESTPLPNSPTPLAVSEGLTYLQLGTPDDKVLALRTYATRAEGPIIAQGNPFPHYVGFGVDLTAFLSDETALVLAAGLPPAVQAWLLAGFGLRDTLADRVDYLELQSYDLSAGLERIQLACSSHPAQAVDGSADITLTDLFAPTLALYECAGRATWPTGNLRLTFGETGSYRITLLIAQPDMLPRLRDVYYVSGALPPLSAELPTLPTVTGAAQLSLSEWYMAARQPAAPFYAAVAVQLLPAAGFPSLWAYLPLAYPQFLSAVELPATPIRRTVARGDQLDVWSVSTTVLAPWPGLPLVTALAYEWRAGMVPALPELLAPTDVSLTVGAVQPAALPYFLLDNQLVQNFINLGCTIPSAELSPYTDDPLALTLNYGSSGQWGAIFHLATEARDLYGLLPASGPEPGIESFLWHGAPPWERQILTRAGGMIRVPAAVGTLRMLLFQARGDGYGLRFQGDTMSSFDLATTFVPFGPYPAYPLVCGGNFTAPAAEYLKYRMPIYAVSGLAANFLGAGYLVGIQIGAGAQTVLLTPGTTPTLTLTTTHGVFRFTLDKELSESNPAKNMLLGMSRTEVTGRYAGFNLSLNTPTMDYDPCALAPNVPKRQYDVLIEKLDSHGNPELFRITQPFTFDLTQLNVATYSAVAPHAVYSYPVYPWAHLAVITPTP